MLSAAISAVIFLMGMRLPLLRASVRAVFVQFPFQGNGFGRIELLVEAVGGDGRKTSKSEPVLGPQHALHMFVHFGLWNAAIGDVAFDFAESGLHVFGQHQHVVAGQQRFGFHFAGFEMFGYTFHFQRIGEGQSLETHFFAQQVGDRIAREGSGAVWRYLMQAR
jgi:hypothetical protein